MAEGKKVKASALIAEIAGLRKEVRGLRQDIANMPTVSLEEARQISAAENAPDDDFRCGNCKALVEKGDATCKSCGEPLNWPSDLTAEPVGETE